MVKIGVFDSGIGGQAIAERLKTLFPDAKIISVNDSEHVPYGSRSEDEIKRLTLRAVQPLIDNTCDAIVIACNTATTVAINSLRKNYPHIHFVGIEPMIKPAAKMTKTNVIAVLATPGTLSSKRYATLKEEWAQGVTIIEPDCSEWAELIEKKQSDTIKLKEMINYLINENVDVIVLGCTHYHWLKSRIQTIVGPNVSLLEPSDAIGTRLSYLLTTATELRG